MATWRISDITLLAVSLVFGLLGSVLLVDRAQRGAAAEWLRSFLRPLTRGLARRPATGHVLRWLLISEPSLCGENSLREGTLAFPLGRNVTIRFLGAGGLAAIRAQSFRQALRKQDGTWERLVVQLPTNSEVKLYCNADKSKRTLQEELVAKCYFKALGEMHPDKTFEFMRAERGVSCEWEGILTVRCPTEGSLQVDWNNGVVTRLAGGRPSGCSRVGERY